jgi:lipopolysaccharide export system protein LptA
MMLKKIQGFIFGMAGLMMVSIAPLPHHALAQDGEKLIVEADTSLQWKRADKQYIATGNASATRGDTRLTADVIIADYVDEIRKDAENKDVNNTTITHIVGKTNATFTRGTLIATGETITYDMSRQNAMMTGKNARIVNGNETLTATQSIQYDRDAKLITATGNAHVVLSNGQELKGNIIKATLNAEENDIVEVIATENAEVYAPGNNGIQQAFAGEMTYSKDTGIAVLTENVTIKEGGNIMNGDKAVIDTINGTSTMSSTESGQRVGGVFLPTQ